MTTTKEQPQDNPNLSCQPVEQPPQTVTEYAWLIERDMLYDEKSSIFYYWCGDKTGTDGWCDSHEHAWRFARKEDAEAFIQYKDLNRFQSVRVVEHGWG